MAVTMEDVRRALDPEEVNYPKAARLGPEALPHLQVLAQSDDVMLASKATYLASLIGGDRAARIVEDSGSHPDPVLRVAAASGVKNLREDLAAPIVERLLADRDLGVRKTTIKSVGAFRSAGMRSRLERMVQNDPDPMIRDLATRSIR